MELNIRQIRVVDALLMDHCFTIIGDKIATLTCQLATA